MHTEAVLSFEEFMRRALYDPDRGYYSRRIAGIGGRGDFTTVPMLADTLGAAIAAWAHTALRETGCRDLIEIGPGEGRLAAAVRRHLPWLRRLGTRLRLVETSRPLTVIQRRTLGRHAIWHDTPADALAACNGRAVIFSNELVDAFPVRRFQKSADGWREVALRTGPQGEVSGETLLPPAPLPESSAFASCHPPGQCVEVHESYRRWLEDWLPKWSAGRMLTIDYGAEAERLYRRRPRGTVRAYLLQQRIEGPEIYLHPGRQDLTADVNFTDLMAWGGRWMAGQRLASLAEFLGQSGTGGLADPAGAGGAFLVLDQECGAGNRPLTFKVAE